MALAAYYAKLIYNANGGSGAPAAQSAYSDEPGASVYVILGAAPSRQYYTFKGWAPSSTAGSGRTPGGKYYMTTSDTLYAANARVYNLYATWQRNTVLIGYDPNGGSGSAWYQTVNQGEQITLSSTVPTRSGYKFLGWATSASATSPAYQAGGKATFTRETRLYAVWEISNSTISSITGSVPIDGTTQGSVSISSINSSYSHELTISIGNSSQVISLAAGVTSATFTIPTSWLAEVPNSTTGTARASLKTFNGSTQVGVADVKTFSITVPASVVPSVSVVTDYVNSNAVVDGWDILLQNYSQIKLTATAAGGTGASVSNIAFSGDGLSQTGIENEATSAVLTSSGSRSWTVTVTDSRGRTVSTVVTDTVHEYFSPSIESLVAFRSDSSGNRDDAAGTYINATGVFSFASADGNNTLTVDAIEYRAEDEQSWTVGEASAASGNSYNFGGGLIKETKMFHVRLSLQDALGNSAEFVVDVSPIIGYAFGLKNDRVHFGGPCKEPGFVCDFPTKLLLGYVVESMATSGAGYVKVCEFSAEGSSVSGPVVFDIIRTADERPTKFTIRFDSSFSLLSFYADGPASGAIAYASDVWALYVPKTAASDVVEILDMHNPWSNSQLVIDFDGSVIGTLPSGATMSTPVDYSTHSDYGDLTKVGQTVSNSPAEISMTASTYTTVAQFTLPAGKWIISGCIRWGMSSTGRRWAALSTAQNSSGSTAAVLLTNEIKGWSDGSGHAFTSFFSVLSVSASTTYYLNGWQNSGGALAALGRLMAVRIG